jgi:hypothetical protein
MWGINPKLLCRKHLMGEHVEMHMFVGTLNKNKSLKGYIDKGLVVVQDIKKRHDILAKEIVKRGFNHQSPIQLNIPLYEAGKINITDNIEDLSSRCEKCKERIKNNVYRKNSKS